MRRIDVRIGPNSGKAGYTLTEMLVVIAIIGLIAAVLTPTLLNQLTRARAKTAQLQVKTLSASLEAYRQDVGHYPTASEGLDALVTAPAGAEGWTGPYVDDKNGLKDPWGHPIVYAVNSVSQRIQLTSLGADGASGGEGADHDIKYPTAAP